MNKQDQADWEFRKRVAEILGAKLHGWSYRDHAAFVNPNMELTGKAIAEKLIEQDDEITRLKALLLDALDAAAGLPVPEWAEAKLREVDNA